MIHKKIPLVKDTVDKKDIKTLIKWLKTNPRLTKGDLTIEFEKQWSKWLGVKYSVFINSGSSANLAMIYSLILSNRLKNNKVIVPSVSWVTTVTPIMQLGLEPIICDCDKDN
jgi:CDP-6-deoxy-D-xylo-4-hexulose-3-dehydrase